MALAKHDIDDLLRELCESEPSVGTGLPANQQFKDSDPDDEIVSDDEWRLVQNLRTKDYGGEDSLTYTLYNFEVLLHFWYCFMDCDPFEYELEPQE